MDSDPVITRRTALVGGLSGAAALALAACSSSGGNATTSATNGSSESSAATTPAASSASSSDALATLSSIKVGEAVSAQLDGKPVLVTRPTATTAACFSAICTHQGATVQPDGTILKCPLHGSEFNIATGAVLQGPAASPLAKVAVTVEDGKVVVS